MKALLLLLLLLSLLSSCHSTAPGERVLELLAQVKSNTENHEKLADHHETERAGICQAKTTGLAEHVSVLRSRLAAAGGEASGASAAEQNATEAGRANLTEASMRDNLEELHRKQDIAVYKHQANELGELRRLVSDGFEHSMDGFTTALRVRGMSHDLFLAHQTQYDSYSSTLDMMLSLMERHAGVEEARTAVREAEQKELKGEHAHVLSAKVAERMNDAAERHQEKELYDARAERMYEVVSEMSSSLAEHFALERAMDKEAADAWSVAQLERTQLGEETDSMLEDLDNKREMLQQQVQNLGGLLERNATVKLVPVDPLVIHKLAKEMKSTIHELNLWSKSCTAQADTFVTAQRQRASVIERLNKLESWVHDSLLTARSVVGSMSTNPTESENESENELTKTTDDDDSTTASPLTPEQTKVASIAYTALQSEIQLSSTPFLGELLEVPPASFQQKEQKDGSIKYSFEVVTTKKEVARMSVVQEKDSLTVEFASAQVVVSSSLPTAEAPKELDVKGLTANLVDDDAAAAAAAAAATGSASDATGGAEEDGRLQEEDEVAENLQ